MTHSGVYKNDYEDTYSVLVAHDSDVNPLHLQDAGITMAGLIQYTVGAEGGPLYIYRGDGEGDSYDLDGNSNVIGLDKEAVDLLLEVADGRAQPTVTYQEYYLAIESYLIGGLSAEEAIKGRKAPGSKTKYEDGTVIREFGAPDMARVYERIHGAWYTPGVFTSYTDAEATANNHEVIYSV